MNKLVVALIVVIAVLAGLLGGILLSSNRTRIAQQTAADSSIVAPDSIPLLTVAQLKNGMLQYNGKQVRVQALIVDDADGVILNGQSEVAQLGTQAQDNEPIADIWAKSAETSSGRIIADDLGSYFTLSPSSPYYKANRYALLDQFDSGAADCKVSGLCVD